MRRFLIDEFGTERTAIYTGTANKDFSRKLARRGWIGMTWPTEYGGGGYSYLDRLVVTEEMCRFGAPVGYHAVGDGQAGPALIRFGSEELKNDLLPKIAQGELLATLALTEESQGWRAEDIELKAVKDGTDFVLNGTKLFVLDAHISDLIVTAARTDDGVSLFLVDRNSDGLTVTPLSTIANDKQCEVGYEDVRVPAARVLGVLDKGWSAIEKVLDRAAVAKCAESLGGAQEVLEMTVRYAKDRVQFGRPIGSFQVIQHYCADMATDVDSIRFLTYRAAWDLTQGLPAREDVAVAKAITGDAYRRVTAMAQQVHGAIGSTKEHDAQLFFRRAKVAQLMFGDGAHHRETVARALAI